MKRLLLLVLLTGCQVGPSYIPPQMCIEDHWMEEVDLGNLLPWWEQFNDPCLTQCLAYLLEDNYDARIARERLNESIALLRVARSGFYPKIDANIEYTRSQPAGGTLEVGSGSFLPPTVTEIDIEQENFLAGFDARWELDFFGRTKSLAQGALANIQMTAASLDNVLVSLLAEFGRSYITLRATQGQILLTERELALYEKRKGLIKQRWERGLENESAYLSASSQYSLLRAELESLRADAHALAANLSVLLARQPTFLFEEYQGIPSTDQTIEVALPSELLRRRPDIRLAERTIAKQSAQVRVSTADLFPRITLTGRVGYEFLELGALSGDGFSWLYGAGVLTPIFHGGELRGKLSQQQSILRQAYLDYGRRVLIALEEAEEAIVRLNKARESDRFTREACSDIEKSYNISSDRFRVGLANELPVIEAEYSLIEAEKQCLITRAQASIQLIALYKAFGGGWCN